MSFIAIQGEKEGSQHCVASNQNEELMHHSCIIQFFVIHFGQCNASTAYSFRDVSQRVVDLRLLNRKLSKTKWGRFLSRKVLGLFRSANEKLYEIIIVIITIIAY